MVWTEEMIRDEIRKLDSITGFHGSDLQISFNRELCRLGYYKSSRREKSFSFSELYFKNDKWSEECALDTIRHEYAHFLDDMIYGNNDDHGETWKKCCEMVGAIPESKHFGARYVHNWNKERREKEISELCNSFRVGEWIEHPKFGKGVIESINDEECNRRAVVRFGESVKTLSLKWVVVNCRY